MTYETIRHNALALIETLTASGQRMQGSVNADPANLAVRVIAARYPVCVRILQRGLVAAEEARQRGEDGERVLKLAVSDSAAVLTEFADAIASAMPDPVLAQDYKLEVAGLAHKRAVLKGTSEPPEPPKEG